MTEFFSSFWLQILKYGGIVAGILLVLFKVRQSGKETIERKQAMKTLRGVQTRDKIENSVAAASNDKLDKLRGEWER